MAVCCQVLINKEYLQMEPIGLVFVFFFALILLIQFIAMLFHRFVTLSHILSSCELTSCCNTEVRSATVPALALAPSSSPWLASERNPKHIMPPVHASCLWIKIRWSVLNC